MARVDHPREQIEETLKDSCISVCRYRSLSFSFFPAMIDLFEQDGLHDHPVLPTAKIPLAQFRFNRITSEWSLYFLGPDDSWSPYDQKAPTRRFAEVLAAFANDKTRAFWK